MNETFEKIAGIIEDIADIPREDIHMDSNLMDDLDLASLEIMSIIAKVEKTFSIKMNEKKLMAIETLADFIKYVDSLQ
ncbi:MAG: acyl carrier protein [Butyrivibrio sp.]|nr:acyl carrier protein [Butyrivibrio sp.]